MSEESNISFLKSYQREIYPAEQFERKKKYGLTILVTSDKELKTYLNNILGQLNS